MSLGGIAIAIGAMIVAVLVMNENVHKHLEAQEGRLVEPLAWTKTLAMAAACLLSVTVVPVTMGLFIRGRIHAE